MGGTSPREDLMGFKLYSDQLMDMPLLACDVCGEKILDIWNDKATGSPGHDGSTTDVKIHHAKCQAPQGTVTMALVDFIRLFVLTNRPGNASSDKKMDRITVEYPIGKRFSK
jgi:hypothetical protein